MSLNASAKSQEERLTAVVLVHGIWNRQRGLTPAEAALGLASNARARLEHGLSVAGLFHVPVPDVSMAYYAHLLADDLAEEQAGDGRDGLHCLSRAQLAQVWEWLVAAGVPELNEAQATYLMPVRQGLGWLVQHRLGDGLSSRVRQQLTERLSRLVVALVQDMDAYASRPGRRRAVRESVAHVIRRERPRAVIGHSLGSVVAYETLHAFPDLEVELLVTLGSPLGLPAMMRRLEPEPRDGRGARPEGIRRWINIADSGDVVAIPPRLGDAFPVDVHETVDIGLLDPHTLGGYLANGALAAAIAPYLSS
ncbi:hypothetical protein [Streptomyces sp. NBC_01750]|uniref:hypothetical protein n=1 Tax=Streptomyces sp. NBC_01750 TaxID=2975928 RepID=UPI002DD82815|nr:hypothetical protein [Streptomyces sp. NBC_01750]WSD30604.1 hypothetical protein OG966_00555 [Streptomyces sp. NBC_01750]